MTLPEYIQSFEDYFWEWEDAGEVITIPDSITIAYTAQITELLSKSAIHGFPPFGSVILFFIAVNPQSNSGIESVRDILKRHLSTDVGDVIKFLKVIASLPKEFKSGDNLHRLFVTLFDNCHNRTSQKDAMSFLESLRKSVDVHQIQNPIAFRRTVLSKDLRTIALLNRRFDSPKKIIEEITTLIEVDLHLEEGVLKTGDDYLETMMEDSRTLSVAQLVKYIWAGLNIPFEMNLPSNQPLGGVANLTNKGDFDKMLLSEFAHDDLVFMSRLVNGESLFFSREVPPQDNKKQRVILIDNSLKNWGNIKSIAYSVMVAIAKNEKSDYECKAFAIGEDAQEVLFDTAEQLIEGMSRLGRTLDASTGFCDYLDKHHEKNAELFFISGMESIQTQGMQRLIGDYGNDINYWVHPTAAGELALYQQRKSGMKHIRTIQIPLERLWVPIKRKSGILPQIEVHNKLPLLVPNPSGVLRLAYTWDGFIYKITKRKAVFRILETDYDKGSLGWEFLGCGYSVYKGEFAVGRFENGREVLLNYNDSKRTCILVDLNSSEKLAEIPLNLSPPFKSNFFFYDNSFFYKKGIETLKIGTDGIASDAQESFDASPKMHELYLDKLESVSRRVRTGLSLFRNVKELYINDTGHLVFNIHKLYLNSGNVIKLDPTADRRKVVEAKQKENQTFVFPDSSHIQVHPSGVFILTSSDKRIPPIFVPSLLDRALGVSNGECFAGNTFYHRKSGVQVQLTRGGSSPLGLVKAVKDCFGLGLKHAKEVVDGAPKVIGFYDHQKAEAFKVMAEDLNAQVDFIEESSETPIMDNVEFYKSTIQLFVEQILAHGN